MYANMQISRHVTNRSHKRESAAYTYMEQPHDYEATFAPWWRRVVQVTRLQELLQLVTHFF